MLGASLWRKFRAVGQTCLDRHKAAAAAALLRSELSAPHRVGACCPTCGGADKLDGHPDAPGVPAPGRQAWQAGNVADRVGGSVAGMAGRQRGFEWLSQAGTIQLHPYQCIHQPGVLCGAQAASLGLC